MSDEIDPEKETGEVAHCIYCDWETPNDEGCIARCREHDARCGKNPLVMKLGLAEGLLQAAVATIKLIALEEDDRHD